MPGSAYERVYEIAEDQNGYVTTGQAAEAGVTRHALARMADRGTVERVSRGVYRIVQFPPSALDRLLEATLWRQGVRGVISHASALSLYELSDVNPSKIHLTVPTTFRIQRDIPPALVVHRVDLPKSDVGYHEGTPVTTAERTIRDCHAAHLGPALVRQAIEDGLLSGHLRRAQAETLERELLGGHALPEAG